MGFVSNTSFTPGSRGELNVYDLGKGWPSWQIRLERYSLYNSLLKSSMNTTNLNVNGSISPIEFYLEPQSDSDIRILYIRLILVDNNLSLDKFGGLPPLINGLNLKIQEETKISYLFQNTKTIKDIIAQSGAHANESTDAFQIKKWSGNTSAYCIDIPIAQHLPTGLRLAQSSTDKLTCEVRDNLTQLQELSIYIYGYRHYP